MEMDRKAAFALKIINIDYYMSSGHPDLDETVGQFGKLAKVPVVRIYGSTPLGQKGCIFLHRVCIHASCFYPLFILRSGQFGAMDVWTHQ